MECADLWQVIVNGKIVRRLRRITGVGINTWSLDACSSAEAVSRPKPIRFVQGRGRGRGPARERGRLAVTRRLAIYPDALEPKSYIDISTVDGFQGREKDIIIFSCVRANVSHQIGFLKDYRRLNVAITRARNGLFVLGNRSTLQPDPLWARYLDHIRDHSLEGSLSDWKPPERAEPTNNKSTPAGGSKKKKAKKPSARGKNKKL